jgi:tRNA (cytidine/uridine-2'-O-)-methyltransferase
MFHVVLFQPEIPPNTGNIIRLCANTGAQLHLIEPLGFAMEDRQLRRAGLDYHEFARVQVHRHYADFMQRIAPRRLFAFSTKGRRLYSDVSYQTGDTLMFGPESRGLPPEILSSIAVDHLLRVPMLENSRSLNLSNTVAVALYEAWRQHDFGGKG